MFTIKIGPAEAEARLRGINHKQFLKSIPSKWHVNAERRIRPKSICWLFVWAANADPKWQGPAERLRMLFDEAMPFTYKHFAEKIGKAYAKALSEDENDSNVIEVLTDLLGSATRKPPISVELASIADKLEREGAFNPLDLKDERERRL